MTEADCEAIWELVKWGPTSANGLPARFLWLLSAEAKAQLAPMMSAGNRDKTMAAPAVVVIGVAGDWHDALPELFPHEDARSWFAGNEAAIAATAFRNSSLQGAYLILAARALGFDVGPMSGFDAAAVDAAFFAGTTTTTNFICTLGHGVAGHTHPRLPRPPFARFNAVR